MDELPPKDELAACCSARHPGALMTGLGCIVISRHIVFLWLASFGLAVNRCGDLLDGAFARRRWA